jgi:hypothetical protein
MFVSRMIPLVALVLLLPMPSISAPISATTTRDASPALPTSTPQGIDHFLKILPHVCIHLTVAFSFSP